MTTKELLASIIEKLDYIDPASIPNIDLYMDQVTTFMDANLKDSKRRQEDKILTKTMINNYAKNNLLPPPVKKKYSREHLFMLIFIYYLKNLLSISDIQTLLAPLSEQYFSGQTDLKLEEIYTTIFEMEKKQLLPLERDVLHKFKKSREMFPDVSKENLEYLQNFAFISMLSFDVYIKKQMIEKMVDDMTEKNGKGKKKKE